MFGLPKRDFRRGGKQVPGVDPGIHGGLAVVDSAAPQIIDSIELPVVGVGAKERIDVLAIRSWVEMHRPDHAMIERAQAMPKQGASSGFKYGRAVGAIEAVIALCAATAIRSQKLSQLTLSTSASSSAAGFKAGIT
jgi:crossover junction endodeoxyribonuclease RuvC